MSALAAELGDAGGLEAPRRAFARLRELLAEALREGAAELARPRSGYTEPVTVAAGVQDGVAYAATPAPAAMRADPAAAGERTWLLVAATIGALSDLAALPAPARREDLALQAGAYDGFLAVVLPAPSAEPQALGELLPLAFEEHAAGIDRLRARALALPGAVLAEVVADVRAPVGPAHPLRVAEALARLGGRPADPDDVERHDEEVLALVGSGSGPTRPHEDPEPGRRIARRILQRLDGMGKWGGYHTEFAHLPRGFAGNERALAQQVGEALLDSGLLAEKPSVGQRHVFLNPRRAADIRALIESGAEPAGLRLPR